MQFPTNGEAHDRVRDARKQFQRLLAQWATDLLELESRHERAPRWTRRPGNAPHLAEPIDLGIELDIDRGTQRRRAA